MKIICAVEDEIIKTSDIQKEHGLSFWVEIPEGVVLFDTGQTGSVLSHNLQTLELSIQKINALALSHTHYDHTGGLETVLSTRKDIPIYANPDIFRPRYALRNGEYQAAGMRFDQSRLASFAKIKLSDQPVEILPGLWTTGEIVERPEPQGSSSHLFIRTDKGWEADPYLDDMSLVYRGRSGLVMICGCCHAGVLNTLFHVRRVFSEPIKAVIGGIHLLHAEDYYLDHVVTTVEQNFPDLVFYVNHCSGNNAYTKLTKTLGKRVNRCPAGTILDFE